MTAWINGILGVLLTFGLGTTLLSLSIGEVSVCVVASVASGLIAVLTILRGEAQPWIRRHVLTRSARTWPIFVFIYFASLWILAPPLRNAHHLAILIIPLIFCTGFTILIFGPIQDAWVARRQKVGGSRVSSGAVDPAGGVWFIGYHGRKCGRKCGG